MRNINRYFKKLNPDFGRGAEAVLRDLLSHDDAQSMLAWPHSGFHVHHAVRLEADYAHGILQLARCTARGPMALERLHYEAKKRQVHIVSDKEDGPTAGTHTFDALEFLALILAHIPDSHEILVRYYGAYSVRWRAAWRQAGILTEVRERGGGVLGSGLETTTEDSPTWPQLLARRRRWAHRVAHQVQVS